MQIETIVSKAGLEKLQAELDELINVRRPRIAARIKEARELGDLKENAEYHDAKNEQAFIETRIHVIEEKLRTAVIVEATDTSTVVVGTRVRTMDLDDKSVEDWRIVGASEADPMENRISNESPIGKALCGLKVGESVDIELPRGSMHLRVEEINLA
jgi:transcription elongation factor GreA